MPLAPLLHQKKDHHFYGTASNQNLWDNDSRCCPKVSSFYHKSAKLKNQRLMQAVVQMREQDQQRSQRLHVSTRERSLERLKERKLERKVLTFSSNQPGLQLKEIEDFGEIQENSSLYGVIDQLKSKRGLRFKPQDPARACSKEQDHFWSTSRLKQSSSKNFALVMCQSVLKRDQEGCLSILERINASQGRQLNKKMSQTMFRHLQRNQLVRRHEGRIDCEERSGIKNNYECLKSQLVAVLAERQQRSQMSKSVTQRNIRSNQTAVQQLDDNWNILESQYSAIME